MKYGGVVKGQRKVLIVQDDPNMEAKEYSIPRSVHVNVEPPHRARKRAVGTPAEGDRVRAGDPLMDGPTSPPGYVG